MIKKKHYCGIIPSKITYHDPSMTYLEKYVISATYTFHNQISNICFTFANDRPVIHNILKNYKNNTELPDYAIVTTLTNMVEEAFSFFPYIFDKQFNVSSYGISKNTSFIKGTIKIVAPQDKYEETLKEEDDNTDIIDPIFSILCGLSAYNLYFPNSLNNTSDSEITVPKDEGSQTNGEL